MLDMDTQQMQVDDAVNKNSADSVANETEREEVCMPPKITACSGTAGIETQT